MSGRYGVPAAQQLRFARKPTGPTLRRTAVVNPADRGLLRDHNLRLVLPGWSPSLLVAFRMIILVRFFSGMYTALSGYNEVYNYWEPLHYLIHGKGFQTREYSPDSALQSYAFLALSAIPAFVGRWFNLPNKRVSFFLLRLTLGSVSSFVEAFFYRAVVDHVSPHVGRYVLWGFIFSSAFYDGATTLVPETFALLGVLLGSAYALRPADASARRIVSAVVAFSAASFIASPLVGLIALPLVVEQLFLQGTEEKVVKGQAAVAMANRASKLGLALLAGTSVLLPIVLIDSRAYGKLAIVPFNVLKHSLAAASLTPNWSLLSYYIHQAVLGFNILLPLGILSLPALALTVIVDPKRFGDLRVRLPGQTHPALSLALRLIPMHVWFLVLAFQSRQEPTLLYPAYPFILLNGTVTVYFVRCWIEQSYLAITKSPYRSTKTSLFSNVTRGFMVLTCLLSFARITAEYDHFHSPMSVYAHLQNYELPRLAISRFRTLYGARAPDPTLPRLNFSIALDNSQTVIELDPLHALGLRLCLGEEWTRFPSHFLIPDQVEVKFIKGLQGSVPQPWVPSAGAGLWGRATNVSPSSKVQEGLVDPSTCHYLVDLEYPLRGDAVQPNFSLAKWDRVFCAPFLDVEKSSRWTTAWKLPLPEKWQGRTSYGDYCLLRNHNLL